MWKTKNSPSPWEQTTRAGKGQEVAGRDHAFIILRNGAVRLLLSAEVRGPLTLLFLSVLKLQPARLCCWVFFPSPGCWVRPAPGSVGQDGPAAVTAIHLSLISRPLMWRNLPEGHCVTRREVTFHCYFFFQLSYTCIHKQLHSDVYCCGVAWDRFLW